MEYTKCFVEYLRNVLEIPSLNIVGIYDVKVVDVKRGNYLFVYTLDRTVDYFLGGKKRMENVGVAFDFRGDNYGMYISVKNSLKFALVGLSGGCSDSRGFQVETTNEEELSDKARGLYRFVLNTYLYAIYDESDTSF